MLKKKFGRSGKCLYLCIYFWKIFLLIMDEKNLYIICGCNGAGKTTASFTILPVVLECKEFVNSDEIAKGLSPFQPETVMIQAGKIMVRRVDQLLASGESLSVETTLATRTYLRLVEKAHSYGYKVSLLYFWLNSPQLAELRVAMRVLEGGHDVPKNVIRRRYSMGAKYLFELYMPIVDYWAIFDNSSLQHVLVADGGCQVATRIHNETIFNQIKNYVGRRS